MLPETIQNFISTAFKSEVHYKRFVEHVGKQEAAVTDREFSRNVPLKDLKSAVATLENVMQPLEDCMDEMVCFHSRESHLFKVHMNLTLGHGHHQLQFKVRLLSKVHVCGLYPCVTMHTMNGYIRH